MPARLPSLSSSLLSLPDRAGRPARLPGGPAGRQEYARAVETLLVYATNIVEHPGPSLVHPPPPAAPSPTERLPVLINPLHTHTHTPPHPPPLPQLNGFCAQAPLASTPSACPAPLGPLCPAPSLCVCVRVGGAGGGQES